MKEQFNVVVSSQEEYRLLVEQIKAQGGHITHTFPLKGTDQGISVQ